MCEAVFLTFLEKIFTGFIQIEGLESVWKLRFSTERANGV